VTLTIYHSFADVTLDADAPQPDGDDARLADAPWANPGAPPRFRSDADVAALQEMRPSLSLTPLEASRRIVPHPRDLRRGMRGFDVLALQRAMGTTRFRRWGGNTGQFGKALEQQVRALQTAHHLPADGVYGPRTHALLAPAYDAYGIRLLNLVHVRTPSELRLATLMSAAMVLYNRRSIVHYTQGPSRMQIVRRRLKLRDLNVVSSLWEDCSSSTTGLYYVAGLGDPNGLGYNGFGFTGTQVVHGREVAASSAPAGALIFYGRGFPYHHVTMSVGGGRVFSHGSEFGPRLQAWNYRGDVARCRVYPGLPT
jgi:hypothetical protein